MQIDKEVVRKMAELSRVRLTDGEVARLETEFKELFGYFSSLDGTVSGAEQLHYVSGVKAHLRKDEPNPKPKSDADAIVANFASKDERYLSAPKSMD